MVALALCLLLNAGGDDDEYLVSDRPVETMNRRELKLELSQLDEHRPGIGGPIAMVSVGGGLIAYGGLFLLSTASTAFRGSGITAGHIFVSMLAIGVGLLVPGIWLMWIRRDPRALMGDRMDAINAQLESREHDDDRRRRG